MITKAQFVQWLKDHGACPQKLRSVKESKKSLIQLWYSNSFKVDDRNWLLNRIYYNLPASVAEEFTSEMAPAILSALRNVKAMYSLVDRTTFMAGALCDRLLDRNPARLFYGLSWIPLNFPSTNANPGKGIEACLQNVMRKHISPQTLAKYIAQTTTYRQRHKV